MNHFAETKTFILLSSLQVMLYLVLISADDSSMTVQTSSLKIPKYIGDSRIQAPRSSYYTRVRRYSGAAMAYKFMQESSTKIDCSSQTINYLSLQLPHRYLDRVSKWSMLRTRWIKARRNANLAAAEGICVCVVNLSTYCMLSSVRWLRAVPQRKREALTALPNYWSRLVTTKRWWLHHSKPLSTASNDVPPEYSVNFPWNDIQGYLARYQGRRTESCPTYTACLFSAPCERRLVTVLQTR